MLNSINAYLRKDICIPYQITIKKVYVTYLSILIFQRDVAMFSPYSFAKETQEYNLSEKQENKRTDDVYNHLHEHTEQVDDTYAHACAVPNHCTDLSEYSNILDAATFRPSSSTNGDDYSILTH